VIKNIKNISIFIFIASMLLVSCGFKKINQNEISPIYIQNLNIIGDVRDGYILKNNILLISNKNANNRYEIEINLKKNTINKIKDTTGKVTRYNTVISAKVTLKNIDNLKIINKTFTKNYDYDVAKEHSQTIINAKEATSNIIQQISNDIINFITLFIKN